MKTDNLSLSQLNHKIRSIFYSGFPDPVWVIAEINEFRINSSGHCYMELIEKDTESDHILARIKASIWSATFRVLKPYFETSTGCRLEAGLKVLILAQPQFHEVYGVSLIVSDIDPGFTLGDLARKKREILLRLKDSGVIDMNRMLSLPLVPQRIAVISSKTAAGFEDFTETLKNNLYSYRFNVRLIPALMQGENAAGSIIEALDQIYEREEDFDLVVIIRGGGATTDLECFNSYDLAYHITQFPLPVVCGIGHERDETIADIVAHTSLKTPTAVAGWLIDQVVEFEAGLDELQSGITDLAGDIINGEKQRIQEYSVNITHVLEKRLNAENVKLIHSGKKLGYLSSKFHMKKTEIVSSCIYRLSLLSTSLVKTELRKSENNIQRLLRSTEASLGYWNEYISGRAKNLASLDPENVLSRGYSITSFAGKIIRDGTSLKEGDELHTRFLKGRVKSIVRRSDP